MRVGVDQFVKADGMCELASDFRISLLVDPPDLVALDLQHAAHSNGTVLQLVIELIVGAARQQNISAPGSENRQERKSGCLLERQPRAKAAWKREFHLLM